MSSDQPNPAITLASPSPSSCHHDSAILAPTHQAAIYGARLQYIGLQRKPQPPSPYTSVATSPKPTRSLTRTLRAPSGPYTNPSIWCPLVAHDGNNARPPPQQALGTPRGRVSNALSRAIRLRGTALSTTPATGSFDTERGRLMDSHTATATSASMPFRGRAAPLHPIFSSRPCRDRVRAPVQSIEPNDGSNAISPSSRPRRTHRPGPTIPASNASTRKDLSKVNLAEYAN
ncbi:hypothetical protein BOTBODRAFT_178045 [Botryobasidium botryosum FD-172 SS1]|uniref:Uncharacterized protein n=1 Tax=Botryobasidium botryosum (strain FD-172 SS1) TaxID=930990 RepID=A0A067M443_BOTB1|nr:hypothetical protein BOTBODRAFT_178045 [Botryobasidium botryosum FD-172 SS1]